MPFLDHLEELRRRILWSLGAIVLAFGAGFWLVERFQLVTLLKRPIEPYLTGGQLVVLSPTEPVMIVLKLGLIVGLVLASPVIIWQIWAFVAPALYAREKKALVPALFVGTLLFMTGAAAAYLLVVPQALRVLFSFQSEAILPMITYGAYFSFVMQIVLALGLSFELPLIIIILAWLGVVTPAMLHRFRRAAVVLACVAGAVLSPGADLLSMVLMTIPLIVLYEVGFIGSLVIHRRRLRRAATTTVVTLLLMLLGGTAVEAQDSIPRRPDSVRVPRQGLDSARIRRQLGDSARRGAPGAPVDSATAERMGLPTAPTRKFADPDSMVQALLGRPGYDVTRYRADSATLFAEDKRIVLEGEAMTERQEVILEADSIGYREDDCLLSAAGDPRLFDQGQVLVGGGITYNTCERRGVIREALTNFEEGSTVWFLRGTVANDSTSRRLFAASSDITSCDLPVSHYHFAARQVKWVSQNMLVARPIVLYVRDVPIMWLPFLFQDTRPGRHSGILIPQFGINDIVRTSSGYRRQITNIGYYWAPNDYFDATVKLDWYSGRYVQYGVNGSYDWMSRFLSGSVTVDRQVQNDGASSFGLGWRHEQQFNLSTRLAFDIDYASAGQVRNDNAIDPNLNTRGLTSSLNFSKRYGWGTFTLGGSRQQSLTDDRVEQTLPTVTITPKALALSRSLTWTPSLSFTNRQSLNTPETPFPVVVPGGGIDTIIRSSDARTTQLSIGTPLRIGSFNWGNTLSISDQQSDRPGALQFREDDPTTPEPNDSVPVVRFFNGDFSTNLDWNTSINLPTLFRGTWKLQPALGVSNVTSGPFALRNRNTGGDWVVQGKRASLRTSATPTFFGFFPGVGPISRIRHSVSPQLTWSYAPAADIPEEFARAILTSPTQIPRLRSDPEHRVSLSLQQAFEAKGQPEPDDTLGLQSPNIRKYRLLSISTTALTYDFEQAKLPGRTGWATPSITNSFLSDLLPGFNLSISHDLWRGALGSDTSRFVPFLTSVQTSFGISSRTFQSIGRALGLGGAGGAEGDAVDPGDPFDDRDRQRDVPGGFGGIGGGGLGGRYGGRSDTGYGLMPGRGFNASFNYSLTRTRPVPNQPPPRDRQDLGLSLSFSPTPLWSLGWTTQYNFTEGQFEAQQLVLERDLHEWRARFTFLKNPNGNFALYFSIYLTDLPDLKFDYDQTTIER